MKTIRPKQLLMTGTIGFTLGIFGLVGLGIVTSLGQNAFAQSGSRMQGVVESKKRQAELQIKNLLEPLLEKYCRDECKLMSVAVDVDLATRQDFSPGFEDVDPRAIADLEPTSGKIKLLIDEKVGPISRGKFLELTQQFLDTLDFPVKIDTQIARFPQPVGSASKVAELREKTTKEFRTTIDDLFRQFCPDRCLLADYDLDTEVVNAEEAQYGASGEFVEDGGVALRLKNISGTILMDESLTPEEQKNVLEMARLKTNFFKNVSLSAKGMRFPRPGEEGFGADGTGRAGRGLASSKTDKTENTTNASSNSTNTSNSNESNTRQERFERVEKIERVESGDAVQKELQKFKVAGLIISCAIIALLVFVAMSTLRTGDGRNSPIQRIIQSFSQDPVNAPAPISSGSDSPSREDRVKLVTLRYEIERLIEEMMAVFAQHPKVAKQVFTRVLTEEGIETTSHYIHIFGESVVMDMLRDPSLQSDMSELMEYYAKNPAEITDEEKLTLLKSLHNRTVAGKLVVMGSRSSHLFDFLADMDGLQIGELIRNESLTVKSIIMTQCDPQKRQAIFAQMDEAARMKLLTELSRIDYLPRDYIFNVANALKRKRRENPRLNTEALPGSEVLVNLLERTPADLQKTVLKSLELTNPDSARTVKAKLVSLDTLKHLRDGQMLEVILSLRHDELIQFLKGTADEIRASVFQKAPKDLVAELEEELEVAQPASRESYMGLERKVLNRMKVMANEGIINLVETNERMLASAGGPGFIDAGPPDISNDPNIKKVAGW